MPLGASICLAPHPPPLRCSSVTGFSMRPRRASMGRRSAAIWGTLFIVGPLDPSRWVCSRPLVRTFSAADTLVVRRGPVQGRQKLDRLSFRFGGQYFERTCGPLLFPDRGCRLRSVNPRRSSTTGGDRDVAARPGRCCVSGQPRLPVLGLHPGRLPHQEERATVSPCDVARDLTERARKPPRAVLSSPCCFCPSGAKTQRKSVSTCGRTFPTRPIACSPSSQRHRSDWRRPRPTWSWTSLGEARGTWGLWSWCPKEKRTDGLQYVW